MEAMKPRERMLAALRRKDVDRIPYVETRIRNGIASRICGEPINLEWSTTPEDLPKMTGRQVAEEQKKVCKVMNKCNIQFCSFAPIFCHRMTQSTDGSPVLIGDGMIKSWEDFERTFKLPSPTTPSFIERARDFVQHKGDYAAGATMRLGIGATLLSMGIEAFSYAMEDDPELVMAVHNEYASWTEKLIAVFEEIGFDLFWVCDDIAFNSGPIFSPEFYRDSIVPVEQKIVANCNVPVISHSDGNMTPVMDIWLQLGQDAIHPIQPDVMDIFDVKRRYGDRVAIIGNVFMTDLVDQTPEKISGQVKKLITHVGEGGGYLLSSSNSLTDDMKLENVLAMRDTLEMYGRYEETAIS